MNKIPPELDRRNPIVEILGEAIAHALRQPGVLDAIRAATTPKPPELVSDGERLHSKKETALRLGVSQSTVDRLTKEGMPVAAYVGDSRKFDIEACRAWLAARGKRPTKAAPPSNDVDISDVVAAAGLVAR